MITGVIPQTGRTCYASLSRLSSVTRKDLSGVRQALEDSKGYATPDSAEAYKYLAGLQGQGYLTLQVDRKRTDRPYRLALLGFDTEIDGVKVRIEGAEPHNSSSLIRLTEADFAIVGFDELLATMQTYLGRNGRVVKRWGSFNAELIEPTDVRIAGSANLKYTDGETGREIQDFDGFFLIGNRRWGYGDVNRMVENGKRVYVKGRYEGIVARTLPRVKTMPVKDVEDAVRSDKDSLGIEIVRSGRTARGKELYVYGEPLFLSESLLVGDYGQYTRNPDLQKVIAAFKPQGFFDLDRLNNFGQWYEFLAGNLDDHWIDRPDVDILFEGSQPSSTLRAYSLKSRKWAPSDDVPTDRKLAEMSFKLQIVPAALRVGMRN